MDDEYIPEIAIIGGGPIGIEAALYARFLGYPVTIYESGPQPCHHVLQWAHVKLFSPFGMNSSPLGRNALDAQSPDKSLPGLDQFHTGQEWIERYLHPLAYTDLVKKSLRLNSKVLSIGRQQQLPEPPVDEDGNLGAGPQHPKFQLLVADEQGQRMETADVVLDCSGTFGNPNSFGAANMPAIGEQQLGKTQLGKNVLTQSIASAAQLSDAAGSGKRFLVIGRGYSAATNVVRLGDLQNELGELSCTWISRCAAQPDTAIASVANDALPERKKLVASANGIAASTAWMKYRAETEVRSILFENDEFKIELSDGSELIVDHVLANTGFHGDFVMLENLQVHRCYASGGPMAWAASIADSSGDCTQQKSAGPDALLTTEPNFYIVGSKSYGRDPRFLFATGLQQIRDVFKVIGERETLDLYGSLAPAESSS